VARIYAAENRRQGALAYAEMAERFFRDKLKANKDDQTARLYLAETLIFMERFAEGIALLQDGYDTANSDPYRLALANAYLRWAQFAALQPGSTLSFRLALLEKTLQLDCSNMEALYSLLAITRLQRRTVYVPPPNLVGILVTPLVPRLERLAADRARADMQELLANGESPATAHLILGMEAQGRGKQTEARVHFEQSYKLDPHMPVIVNNLAWSLTHVQPVDLDRALLLINDLLERWPKQLNYRETRGQILTRQGKWKEALTDLEAALPAMRFSRELHAALALCYDKLGVPEMRDQHRKFLPTSPVGLLP
jgi:Flp pilus assembly protein TadD